MNLILAVLALLPAQGPSSDEEAALECLEQARFADLAGALEKDPQDSPRRAVLLDPVRRLAKLHDALIEAIGRSPAGVDYKEVHPRALKGGRVVGATRTTLKVREKDAEREVIWAGLPASVTFELAKRYLVEEAMADRSLLRDLADGLGVEEPLASLDAERMAGLQAARRVRLLIGRRALAEAQEFLQNQTPGPGEGLWMALCRVWVARLDRMRKEFERKKEEALKALPKGTQAFFSHDFEEGPELVARGWERGLVEPPPDGATPKNRWCRRSAFMGKELDWGEMLDQFVADRDSEGKKSPVFTMTDRTWFACRIWAENVDEITLGLASPFEGGERYSLIPASVHSTNRWLDLKVRLDDFVHHRSFRGVPLLRNGDLVWKVVVKARRADLGRSTGAFFLDDVRIFSAPAVDEIEEK